MLPTDFPEANTTLSKPADSTDEQCTGLRAWSGEVVVDENGTKWPCIISKWQPSKEDIDTINAGGAIWLQVYGRGMSPVLLSTDYPFVSVETAE